MNAVLNVLEAVWAVAGSVVAAAGLPGSVELLILTAGGALPARRRSVSPPGPALRIAVVVPAHDEEAGIGSTVQSLLAAEPASPAFAVVVVADNCSDATAARAREAGATVLERTNHEQRGKGYALDFAFRTLLPEGWDAFLVVDADTEVDPGFVAAARGAFSRGAAAVQAAYRVRNPGTSMRTRLMNVALLAFNVLRPRGRERWGLSTGILGNGFGLARATLEAVPYDASSVVEDLEYHLRLVESGRRVEFLGEVAVLGEMPSGEKASKTQRARWEGGRLRMLREHAPKLAGKVLAGRLRLLEPLLELLLLPLAWHVLLLLLAVAIPFGPSRLVALAGLALVVVHVLVAIAAGGGGWRDLGALAGAPFYVAWKLTAARAIARASRKDSAWVRTGREAEAEKGREL